MIKKLAAGLSFAIFLSLFAFVVIPAAHAETDETIAPVAQSALKQVNPYYSTQSTTYSDGAIIQRQVIKGPPRPPAGVERPTVSLPEALRAATATLTVPAFQWVFGCSAVSGSMIAGYYDRNGFPNIYTGPTNGGVYPLIEDSSWGTWTDGYTTYPNNPLIASHAGLDGRSASLKGSIDDYWVQYGSSASDPYVTGGWTQHTWSDAIGDYMKTSQSAYYNSDGSTTFYNLGATKFQCANMTRYSDMGTTIANLDGTYGRKLFYEARGYSVSDCYSQATDNTATGGFSFANYKAQIDAGHPVMLNLDGHTIVGVGYNDSVSTDNVYIHDTWDNSTHTMTWGGSYSEMELHSVSIVIPVACTYTVSPATKALTYRGGTFNVTVTGRGAKTCGSPSVAVSDGSWITATLMSWNKTRGTVKVTVPANTTTSPLTGSVSVQGGQAFLTLTQAGAPCSLLISPLSGTATNEAQTGTFSVTATAGCAWSATVLAGGAWLNTYSTGTGDGTVAYTVTSNTTRKNRTGTIKTYLTAPPSKSKVFRVIQSK